MINNTGQRDAEKKKREDPPTCDVIACTAGAPLFFFSSLGPVFFEFMVCVRIFFLLEIETML